MTTRPSAAVQCAICILLFSPSALLQAADEYYRTDGTTSTWTSSVWSTTGSSPFTSAWVSGNNAIFNGATSSITGATTTVANITANGNVTVNTGGNMLLSNTTLNVADTKTFLLGASSGSAIGLDSASSITKTGLGTLTIFESTAYTGGFTLSAGIVKMGSTNALGTGSLTFNGGNIQADSTTSRSGTYTGITIGGDFTIGGAGNLTFTAPTIALGGAVRQLTVDNSGTTTLAGVIGGTTGNGFTKLGNGQLNFTGTTANTYSGLTTVSAGTLGLGKSASVNAFGGDLTINGGAVLYSAATNDQIPDAAKVTISSGSLAFGARTETIGITSTATSGLALSGLGAITVASGTIIVANSASMTGGTVTFTSSGTLQLNTDFAFSGGTIDNSSTSTGSGGVFLRGGDGTGITYASTGTSTAQITNTGGGTGVRVSLNSAVNATTVFNIADAPTVANEMTIAVPITSSLNNGNVLEKRGAGQLTLSGANTYTATTIVTAGTLAIDSAGSTTPRLAGTTAITVNSGGTLLLANSSATSSSDRINNSASLTLNGVVADGTGIVTFNTGGLSEVGGTAAAPTVGIGGLTLSSSSIIDFGTGASVIEFTGSGTRTDGTLFINNWSGNSVNGNGTDRLLFSTNPDDTLVANIQFAGFDLGNNAKLDFGSYFEVVPVPEPATVFAGLLLVGALGWNQRRRLGGLAGSLRNARAA